MSFASIAFVFVEHAQMLAICLFVISFELTR